MGTIRGNNSSPGVYSKFTDISYAAKTLGITTLGLVGETLKGPAFEPVKITKWDEFVYYFGELSAEKFKGTQYPKYELPYIAKTYLTKSDQLYVCRVLGLSGYNAGPAFVIYATNDSNANKHVVAVLRSRAHHVKNAADYKKCEHNATTFDTLVFDCSDVTLAPSSKITTTTDCTDGTTGTATPGSKININSLDLGTFIIKATLSGGAIQEIPVSFNVTSKDYIYNVLGMSPETNTNMPLFVEELYDVNLLNLIENGVITEISQQVQTYKEPQIVNICPNVNNILTIPSAQLTNKEIGKTFLFTGCTTGEEELFKAWDMSGTSVNNCQKGYIYTVASATNKVTKEIENVYYETKITEGIVNPYTGNVITGLEIGKALHLVDSVFEGTPILYTAKVLSNNLTYVSKNGVTLNTLAKEISNISFSEYREQFRCAMTPWFVSELKGEGKTIDVKKLFRFYTISDGKSANNMIKISVANIKPEEGTFDILVRDFYDNDASINILETFRGLTMVPGDAKYIGMKIGTIDGAYEIKSKYIMAEIIENEITEKCVPCGFLGYPIRYYGNTMESPTFEYNTVFDTDKNVKKQYFGVSDIIGIDVDMLSYKGLDAYHDSDMTFGYTKPFHLDSTINPEFLSDTKVTIDGDIKTTGITWETVSQNNTGDYAKHPVIGYESEMSDTIYGDIKARKFTACFYGGFDGWDIYREERTNGDAYKANKYKGAIGRTFSYISNTDTLALSGKCINSDYYAYLAGAKQFENPDKFAINIFATPGIDYVNNTLLTNEIISMLEEQRGDAIYVVTTPDKPKGASDAPDEMYSGMDAAANLEDTGIDTYYAATYYPWVKFYDKVNQKYILLPPTKDVVRNMADVDNKKYPWYAPAGLERGNVECVKAHMFTRLEDENEIYDGRINPVKTFAKDGVKIWGNKTMYTGNTPMNRVNVVRLMLYMQKLIKEASLKLIFDPNDATLKKQFEDIVKPILAQIKADRGITDYRLNVSQTTEQMDAHELSANIGVKPTPTLEYIELNFTVTPQGVDFDDVM